MVLWSLSVVAENWQGSKKLFRLSVLPDNSVLKTRWDVGSLLMVGRILRTLRWFGLVEYRDEPGRGEPGLWRKSTLFDRFLTFDIRLQDLGAARQESDRNEGSAGGNTDRRVTRMAGQREMKGIAAVRALSGGGWSGSEAGTLLRIPYGNKEIAFELNAKYGADGWYAPLQVDIGVVRDQVSVAVATADKFPIAGKGVLRWPDCDSSCRGVLAAWRDRNRPNSGGG